MSETEDKINAFKKRIECWANLEIPEYKANVSAEESYHEGWYFGKIKMAQETLEFIKMLDI